MTKMFSEQGLIKDTYSPLSDLSELSSLSDILVSERLWNNHSALLSEHKGKLGLQLSTDTKLEELSSIESLDLIDICFPVFTDGRGFSMASILRESYGYSGELRASGVIILDQLLFLSRCGFSSFLLDEQLSIHDVLNFLEVNSVFYQAGADKSVPLYRRRTFTDPV